MSLGGRNLHDATLRRIELDWAARRVVIDAVADTGEVRIVANKVRRLSCPREDPWGPSASILRLRQQTLSGESPARLEIEMQSGDVISIDAESFEVMP